MQESDLFEELLKIEAKMQITLKNDIGTDYSSTYINIIGVGNLSNETLDEIIRISKLHGANVELTGIGVIEIRFKEEN